MSSDFTIIGLCGGMGSGKTTLAMQIAHNLPHKRCRLASFGDRLKSLVSDTYDIPIEMLFSADGKGSCPPWVIAGSPVKWTDIPQIDFRTIPSYVGTRVDAGKILEINMAITEECVSVGTVPESLTCGRLLQIVGQAFRRMLSEDVWVIALQHVSDDYKKEGNDIMIIDDVRYDNEARWIEANGGFLIKVESDPPTLSSVAKRDPRHQSELGLNAHTHYSYTARLGSRTDGDFVREGRLCAKMISYIEETKVVSCC